MKNKTEKRKAKIERRTARRTNLLAARAEWVLETGQPLSSAQMCYSAARLIADLRHLQEHGDSHGYHTYHPR